MAESGVLDADINTTNEVYLAYRNSGFCWELVVPALLLNLVALPGIVFNLFLLIVTAKNKNLHGPTNILIWFISFCDILHQSSYLLFLAIVLSGSNFVPLRFAFFAQIHSVFGFNATMMLITLVAVDRLFAVVASERRDELNKVLYLSIYALLASAYALWMCYYIMVASEQGPTNPVTGYLTETIIFGKLGWNMVLILISCGIYVLIGIIVCCKTNASFSTHSRVLKSVSLIIGVNLFGYLLNISLFHMMLRFLWGHSVLIWRVSILCSLFLNLAAGSTAPILYWTSSEYREAFLRELAQLGWCKIQQSPGATLFQRSLFKSTTVAAGQQPNLHNDQ